MNAHAQQSRDKPAVIYYAESMQHLNEAAHAAIRSASVTNRTLYNHKTHHHSPAVKSLNELLTEPPWSTTGGQDASTFLIYDNRVNA